MDVKVGQDLADAPSKGLYVEEVVVTASRGDGVVFPCHCWTGNEDKVTVEHVQQTEQEVPLGRSLLCTVERRPFFETISAERWTSDRTDKLRPDDK